MRPGRELPGRFRRWRWASPFTGEQRTRWGSARAAVRRQEVTVEGVATGTRDRAVRRGRGHGHGQTGLAGSVGGFCFSLIMMSMCSSSAAGASSSFLGELRGLGSDD